MFNRKSILLFQLLHSLWFSADEIVFLIHIYLFQLDFLSISLSLSLALLLAYNGCKNTHASWNSSFFFPSFYAIRSFPSTIFQYFNVFSNIYCCWSFICIKSVFCLRENRDSFIFAFFFTEKNSFSNVEISCCCFVMWMYNCNNGENLTMKFYIKINYSLMRL